MKRYTRNIIVIISLLFIGHLAMAQSGSLDYLKKYNDKYPADVKMFETGALKPRLTKLLGTKFKTFKANMDVQVPIVVKNNILFNSGCFPHSCSIDDAAICVFFGSNTIMVGLVTDGKYTLFAEGPVAEESYPADYVKWLDEHGITVKKAKKK